MGWWLPTVSWRGDWSFLVWVGIVSPVLEELVFRGALQGALLQTAWGKKAYGGISVANGLTSVVFVVVHLFNQSLVWAVLVFLPSLIFGAVRERYQSTRYSILLHSYYNLGFFLLR